VLQSVPTGSRDKWSELDGRFCAYPDDLAALMRRYVELNRAGFRSST
jgi:hypothetical protein